jgi:hypothetical protein
MPEAKPEADSFVEDIPGQAGAYGYVDQGLLTRHEQKSAQFYAQESTFSDVA